MPICSVALTDFFVFSIRAIRVIPAYQQAGVDRFYHGAVGIFERGLLPGLLGERVR